MADKLSTAEHLLADFFGSYNPDLYDVDGASENLARMASMKRLLEAGMLHTARRLEKSHVHQREGYKNAGSWLSTITGQPVGQAAASLQAARQIEEHPEVDDAFSTGRLSEAQARQIASAAEAAPSEAARLVEEAPRLTFSDLQKECQSVRAGAASMEDELERHERIRSKRYCRTWIDAEGAGRLEAKMTPDALGVLKASLGPFVQEIFHGARKEGRRESPQAYLLDALLAMASKSASGKFRSSRAAKRSKTTAENGQTAGAPLNAGTGTGLEPDADLSEGPRPLIRIRIDLQALIRGHVIAGETCSIPGIDAPLPVELVRRLIPQALLELVITNGTDVRTVVSDSRYVSRALRIALEERDPVCSVPGCDASDPLEIDHWQTDVKDHGKTEFENLTRICPWHHRLKTHKGWHFEGTPGQWRFIPPDEDTTGNVDLKRQNGPPLQEEML